MNAGFPIVNYLDAETETPDGFLKPEGCKLTIKDISLNAEQIEFDEYNFASHSDGRTIGK